MPKTPLQPDHGSNGVIKVCSFLSILLIMGTVPFYAVIALVNEQSLHFISLQIKNLRILSRIANPKIFEVWLR